MPLERELAKSCPECSETTFYRAASTELHLGEKVKWCCTADDCGYSFVQIGDVTTA